MSVAANQLRAWAEGCLKRYPVATSTHIYDNTLVFANSSGFADDDTASGANKFVGIAAEEKNNAGANGLVSLEVQREGEFKLTGSGFAQTSVGKKVYATDNYTLTLDASASGAVYIGVITEYVSSTVVWVLIDPHATAPTADFTITIPILPHASLTEQNLFVAREALQVLSIDVVPDLVQGGTLTGTVVKASGTATPVNSTTPMHSAAGINFNATAHTVQSITLTSTAADLNLAAGDRIALDLSAALTTGRANITIRLRRI